MYRLARGAYIALSAMCAADRLSSTQHAAGGTTPIRDPRALPPRYRPYEHLYIYSGRKARGKSGNTGTGFGCQVVGLSLRKPKDLRRGRALVVATCCLASAKTWKGRPDSSGRYPLVQDIKEELTPRPNARRGHLLA